MLFSRTLLTSIFAALVSSQFIPTPTTLSPAQETKVLEDFSAYVSSVESQPARTAVVGVLTSAVSSDIQSDMVSNPASYIQNALTATVLQSWFTAVPTSVQAYYSSHAQVEISIISEDIKGPAPTNTVSNAQAEISIISEAVRGPAPAIAARVAGVVMAAGGAALVLL